MKGLKLLGMASWVITALASINVGLHALGFDIFNLGLFQGSLAGLVVPLHYLIGAAGIYSLVMFFSCCCGSEYCDNKSCK